MLSSTCNISCREPLCGCCCCCCRYCLGSGLAMAEMKVLLALVARHYCFTADNNTEWVHTISKVPKVRPARPG